MPKQYEAIRDKFAAKGMDYDEAQTRAAKIYNSTHTQKMGGKEGGVRGSKDYKGLMKTLKKRG